MYAQIDEISNQNNNVAIIKDNDEFDDFDLGFFKMNNQVNLNKFH